ncbi:Vesicle transport v-SNARE protein [Meloidogyne graminicola]|uniref:Vesicle transport v-SNARE protein n=1 Tax=Meloidogyne graminicola TaxID=189291 RepID=A0A8S9ZQ40_9BILA|nr:Vesicle transport v-SNARE protein [Meloidogyne graminicola]
MSSRFNKQNDTKLDLEGEELNFNDRLKHSNNALDDLLAQGENTLRHLREQHYELKGVKRKILDVGQMFGLSNTTLRMIEKRLDEDWLLFLILCVLFIIFMYCFYRYCKVI